MKNLYPQKLALARQVLSAFLLLAVFIGQGKAQCDQTIVADTLVAEYNGSPVDFCTDLDFIVAIRSDRFIDGTQETGFPTGCDYDSIIYYPYTTLPGAGAAGPYELVLWDVDGSFFTTTFTDIDDLVAQMNGFNPTGLWVHDPLTRNIIGGENGRSYSPMTIEQTSSGTRRTINPNILRNANGTLVTVDGAGFHEYVVDDPNTGCRDTLILVLRPRIEDETIDVFTDYNTESADVCLDVSELLGTPQSATICDDPDSGILTDQGAYCYTYTPNFGHVGADLVCIEVCDDSPTPIGPLCKRTFINFITESPANYSTDTVRFQMTNTDTTVCVNGLLELGGLPDGASVCGPVPSGLTIIPTNNGCVDILPDGSFSGPALVCVRHCIGAICDTTILDFTVLSGCDLNIFNPDTDSIPSQGNPTTYCIDLDRAELFQYSLSVNGQPYTGAVGDCNLQEQIFYNYASLFGNGSAGPYSLLNWVVNGVSFQTTFQDPAELLAFMRSTDPQGDWQLDAASFDLFGGDDNSSYAPMDIVHNATGSLSNLQPNPIQIAEGTTINLPGDGVYEIELTDPATGCSDLLTVTVGEVPTTTTETIEVTVFVDSISATTCLFDTPRDTFSICQDVSNGTTSFDANNCVVYEPNPGFLGIDSLCVVSCDLPGGTVCDTIYVIFSVEPRVVGPNPRDTINLTNFGDAPFDLCNGLPIVGPFSSVSICGESGPFTTSLSQDGECIVADPIDGVAGVGEICVTFCLASDPTDCRDVLFIITQTPSCTPALFAQDTVSVPPSMGSIDYCLADGLDLTDYEIYVNGDLTTPTTDPTCGNTSGGGGQEVYFYPLFFISDGPLRIDLWDVSGNTITSISTTSFAQLADTMSALDPGNDWVFDAQEEGLVASSDDGFYSTLFLFDLTTGGEYRIALETLQQGGGGGGGNAGSIITLPQAGIYDVEVIALDGSCGDRLVINRESDIVPVRDTVTFTALTDGGEQVFCLNNSELTLTATSIRSCQDPVNGTMTYSTFNCVEYTPNPGYIGFDTACVIMCTAGGSLCDTTDIIFDVRPDSNCDEIWNETNATATTTDCTVAVNVCLPAFPDEFFNYTVSVDGVIQTGALACGADSLTIYSYADVAGQGQAGPYRIEDYSLTSGTYTENVADINALLDSLNQWDPNGNWMLNPSNFTIFGGVSGFAYNTINLRQIASDTLNRLVPVTTLIENQLGFDLTEGSYVISVVDNRTNCSDTLRYDVICTTDNDCADLSAANGTALSLTDCSASTPFEVISASTNPASLEVYIDGVLTTATLSANSVAVLLPEGFYEVVVVDPVQVCASTFAVTVTCIACPGPLPSNTISVGANCTAANVEVCLPVAPDVLQAYAITVDGQLYTGDLGDCDEGPTFVIDLFELPDGGASGPYAVDSFRINGQLFSGVVSTVQALVDTLNAWDASGAWRLDAAAQLILGGDPLSTYSALLITQVASGQQVRAAILQETLARGTVLTIAPGATTRLLTFDDGVNCVQEVTLNIACTTNSTATDTLTVAESIIFCVNTSELLGPIATLENICPDPGSAATFDFSGQLGCVSATGDSPGSATACLVACDTFGVCDTTFYTVVVEPNESTNGLDAVDDFLRLRLDQQGLISVTANDTFTGPLSSIDLIEEPSRGTAMVSPDGILTYMPTAGECGFTDSLTYQICQGTLCDRALLLIQVRCEPVEAYTGFSPNGDGINDQLRFIGIEDFPENTLTVYNRWGNEVHFANNYQNDWEGTWDGQVLIDGTYFWQLEIAGESEPLTGFIQIQR